MKKHQPFVSWHCKSASPLNTHRLTFRDRTNGRKPVATVNPYTERHKKKKKIEKKERKLILYTSRRHVCILIRFCRTKRGRFKILPQPYETVHTWGRRRTYLHRPRRRRPRDLISRPRPAVLCGRAYAKRIIAARDCDVTSSPFSRPRATLLWETLKLVEIPLTGVCYAVVRATTVFACRPVYAAPVHTSPSHPVDGFFDTGTKRAKCLSKRFWKTEHDVASELRTVLISSTRAP